MFKFVFDKLIVCKFFICKNIATTIYTDKINKLRVLFSLFTIFISLNQSAFGEVTITSLKDNNEILQQMIDNGVHSKKICDKYIDRYVVISGIEYYNFDGTLMKDGVIVANDAFAESVVKIFNELKIKKFPIAKINPIVERKVVNLLPFGLFGLKKKVDDEEANFTSSYCCRKIKDTDRLSLHAYGAAIDLNVLQNPCIYIDEEKKKVNIYPKNGVMYLNRKIVRPDKPFGVGKVDNDVVKIFQKYGYDVWGGDWDTPIDYQHFQVSTRSFVNLLIAVTKNDARKIFNKHVICFNKNGKSLSDIAFEKDIDLLNEYTKDIDLNKKNFFKTINNLCKIKEQKKQLL